MHTSVDHQKVKVTLLLDRVYLAIAKLIKMTAMRTAVRPVISEITARSAFRSTPGNGICSVCACQHVSGPSSLRSTVLQSRLPFSNTRSYSTTSPLHGAFGSFFNPSQYAAAQRSVASTKTDHRADFLGAIRMRDLALFGQAYRAMVAELVSSEDGGSDGTQVLSLSADDMFGALKFLSTLSHPGAVLMARRLWADFPRWRIEPDAGHLDKMMWCHHNAGQPLQAFNLAEANYTIATGNTWRIVLQVATRYGDDGNLIDLILDRLRVYGPLEPEDYVGLFRYLRFTLPADAQDQLVDRLKEARSTGLFLEQKGEAELVHLYIALKDERRARDVIAGWANYRNITDYYRWRALMQYEMAFGTLDKLKIIMQDSKAADVRPYPPALQHIIIGQLEEKFNVLDGDVTASQVCRIVEDVEREWECRVSARVWTNIVDYTIQRTDNLPLAIQVYNEARAQGTVTEIHLASTLILPLCSANPADLSTAMDLLSDVMATSPVITNFAQKSAWVSAFMTLFRAAVQVPTQAGDLVPRLIRDMHSLGLYIPPLEQRHLLINLIAASPNHQAAFNFYAHFHTFNPTAFDLRTYEDVFHAFGELSTPTSTFAPPVFIIEVMRDIRKAGFRLDPGLLTWLLAGYGKQASKSRKSSDDPMYRLNKTTALLRAVNEINDNLKLGSLGIEPDIPLLSSLMNAYNRVEAYASAFEVWDQLVERRSREDSKKVKELYGSPISTILDCCGFSGQSQRSDRIWKWTQRFGLDTQKTWETRVECLCRLDRFEEAVEVVCGDHTQVKVPISKAMAEILLKFCWRSKAAYAMVPIRVKESYPAWWEELKYIVETKSVKEKVAGEGEEEEGDGQSSEL